MSATNDKRLSKIAKECPAIRIKPQIQQVGNPVWCGNKACDEYNRKQEVEHERKNK